MCKSTQDLTIWLAKVAETLQLEPEDISLQIYPDKSFRLYVHTRQEEPAYDSGDNADLTDINDLPYEDPEMFAIMLKEKLEDASDELSGTLSPAEKAVEEDATINSDA